MSTFTATPSYAAGIPLVLMNGRNPATPTRVTAGRDRSFSASAKRCAASPARRRLALSLIHIFAQADESLRIIRNRYSNGLATVTDLLRSETALVEAKTRRLAALYDLRIAAVQLDAASGSLNGDSDVLK